MVIIPLKYLSNICRSLDLSLIKCQREFYLSWSKNRIISQVLSTASVPANPPAATVTAKFITGTTFQITPEFMSL